MKKRIILLMVFILLMVGNLFAEDYRYYMIRETSSGKTLFLIMQMKEKISDEKIKDLQSYGGGSLNTKQDRLAAEAGVKDLQSFYYMGALQPVFFDYTKNADNPDMKIIDSWEEFLKYIRWEK